MDDVEYTFGPYFKSPDTGKDVWIVGINFSQTCMAAISVCIPPQVPDQAMDPSGVLSAPTLYANDDIFEGPLSPPLERETADNMVPKNTYLSGNGAQPDGDMVMDIKENVDYIMYKSHITPQSSTDSKMDIDSTVSVNTSKECFCNLVIKNKALYQPQFWHGWYSEDCKTDAVQAAENSIKSHHGIHGDKVLPYVQSRLMCMDTVTGINEYYLSQKCPLNDPIDPADPCDHGFIAHNNTHWCYCPKCWTYFHHNIMAAQNMIQAAQEHLTQQH
ncbi:hypothetical protein MVEG_10907 [Podila verticillata NRRL 6337]|nr:hypothetical protein MVEG_10907 [Podila verticillata NRRL 6337]